MTVLGLTESHLNAAQELIALENYEQAAHVVEHGIEIYSGIETELPERGVEDFKPTLTQLHSEIETAPESTQVQTLLDESLTSVDNAIAVIPEEQLNSPEFVLNSVVEMLKRAATEYEEAISDNQFADPAKYQSSQAIVSYADGLYQTVAEQKSESDPEQAQIISDSLAELTTAFPSTETPEAPIKETSEIYGLVSQIEFNK